MEHGLDGLLTYEISLVRTDNGWNALPFGPYQKAIQHPQPGFRLRTGNDEDHLVRVGDDYLFSLAQVTLAVPPPGAPSRGQGLEAREGAFSFFYLFDGDRAVRVFFPEDSITDGDNRGVAAFFFESTADSSGNLAPVLTEDGVESTL
jgi:hypothetical protein